MSRLKGDKDSPKTKKKKSEFWKRKWQDKEWKAKMVAGKKRRGLSEEHKLKLYEGRLKNPVKFSKKSRQKISVALKKWWAVPENKARMSAKFKNKNLSELHKSRLTFKGRKHTEESKKKIGAIHRGKVMSESTKAKLSEYHGEKASAWKGGSWRYYNFREFRKSKIRQTYDDKCVVCNNADNLCIHHIDYDPKNSSDNNLIVLCRSCHQKCHRNNWSTEMFIDKLRVVSHG